MDAYLAGQYAGDGAAVFALQFAAETPGAPTYVATLSGIAAACAVGALGAAYVPPDLPLYTAALGGMTAASSVGALAATYTAPDVPQYAAALAGVSCISVLSALQVSYSDGGSPISAVRARIPAATLAAAGAWPQRMAQAPDTPRPAAASARRPLQK